jgi:molybdopterin synthase sulfur carrier subunit
MTITLRFFGQLKELTKTNEIEIQLKKDLNIEALQWIIGERFPNIKEHLNSVSYSVNNEYVNKETTIKEGDIVGLLPPISGG